MFPSVGFDVTKEQLIGELYDGVDGSCMKKAKRDGR